VKIKNEVRRDRKPEMAEVRSERFGVGWKNHGLKAQYFKGLLTIFEEIAFSSGKPRASRSAVKRPRD
jgi:hypothetical protein